MFALRVERGAQERHGGDARHLDRILERQEHALGGALVRRHPQDALAVEQHLALGDVVVVLAGQHISERGLARAVRAHDGRDLALFDGQRQAVEDLLALDLDMQIFDFKQRHYFFVLFLFAVVIVGFVHASHARIARGAEITVLDAGHDADFAGIRIIDDLGRRHAGNAEIA